ncbi:histone-lysine N-methyltransferase SETMAR [Trichonephila clavipes]|nr:histone-lysine N-methyltransferase SETMAR [Trichonephila clavipes]
MRQVRLCNVNLAFLVFSRKSCSDKVVREIHTPKTKSCDQRRDVLPSPPLRDNTVVCPPSPTHTSCELQDVKNGVSKEKIRFYLQFFSDKGENASQVAEIVNDIYGTNTVTANYVQVWFVDSVQNFWELGWEVLMHPPYSTNLEPSDYHSFLTLQNFLSDKKLGSREDCENRLLDVFANKGQDFYERGI